MFQRRVTDVILLKYERDSYDTTPFKKSVPRMTGSYFELFYSSSTQRAQKQNSNDWLIAQLIDLVLI